MSDPSSIFHVSVLKFEILKEIEGSWTVADFSALIEEMDLGDLSGMSEDDTREMCIIGLQDLEPMEAAVRVLEYVLGKRLKSGQIRNIAGQMEDEKMWEEYADMSMHEGLFNAGSLLYAAFPHLFPEPDAVRVNLEVSAGNASAAAVLARPLHESFLVRLLGDGMDAGSALHRLFEEQMDGDPFPEADTIVWIVQSSKADAQTARIDVISSGYWLDALRTTKSYDSSARGDRDG